MVADGVLDSQARAPESRRRCCLKQPVVLVWWVAVLTASIWLLHAGPCMWHGLCDERRLGACSLIRRSCLRVWPLLSISSGCLPANGITVLVTGKWSYQ